MWLLGGRGSRREAVVAAQSEQAGEWQARGQKNKLQYREGIGSPLQYPCLENPMDRGAW